MEIAIQMIVATAQAIPWDATDYFATAFETGKSMMLPMPLPPSPVRAV
jgi:hypothetical protein